MKRYQILLLFAVIFACSFTTLTFKPSPSYDSADAFRNTAQEDDYLQPEGAFVKTDVAEGLCHYLCEGFDSVTGAMQTVNVLRVDLDNENYKVVFDWGSDSTSAAALRHNALAAINATYEPDASYIRVNGQNHSEVSIPAGHLRFWKHDGALVLDGDRNLSIVHGAASGPATAEGGVAAINLYKSLAAPNIFSSSPMLIDDYNPVGASFVPDPLEKPIKEYPYEDYRRHQGVRHPRVAVALTGDNDLLLVVVDGRWPSASGMSAKELTLFLAKHFNPRWALNMDGGGSSTMYLKGYGTEDTNVLNYPTDNKRYDHYGQRRICTHIMICPAKY